MTINSRFIIIIVLIVTGVIFFVWNIVGDRSRKVSNQREAMVLWKSETGGLKNIPDGYNLFLLGWGFTDFDQYSDWNNTNTPFRATVKAISQTEPSLKVVFTGPEKMPFLGLEKDIKIVDCSKKNSFLSIEDSKLKYGEIIFYNYVRAGDSLVGFCLNDECTKLGKLCKIYRNK